MNYEVFQIINSMANQNMVLDAMMIAISKISPYLFILVLAYLYVKGLKLRSREFRAQCVAVGLFVVLCALASMILGMLWYEDRPFVTHQVNLIVAHAADASFPSDHAVGTMAIAMGILYFQQTLGVGLILWSALVGFSRVFVGNHYPGDILGAFILVWVLTYVYNRWVRSYVVYTYKRLEHKVFDK